MKDQRKKKYVYYEKLNQNCDLRIQNHRIEIIRIGVRQVLSYDRLFKSD